MSSKALICGLKGQQLNDEERAFFTTEQPWGYILFARNISDPDQVKSLTKSLRDISGRQDVPILLDQEGGRVQRLRPPHWEQYPPAAALGALYRQDPQKGIRATWLQSRLHAFDQLKLGITVDCMPVLDVPSPDGHDVIGDRAYGPTAEQVSAHGKAACEGLMAGGVMPVLKHIPGHGRATADSHHDLPVVNASRADLEASDFKPFQDLNTIPMAMTAHVIYSDIDPHAPATTSKTVMNDIVRGHMGYGGLVMCDDISMGALSGDFFERTRAVFEAGCDIVLHCHGHMDEMVAVAAETPQLSGKAAQRAKTALIGIGKTDDCDEMDCRQEFGELMGQALIAFAGEEKVDPTNYGETA